MMKTYPVTNSETGKRGEVWYDRRSKNWIARELDAKYNQIGNAVFVYTKREAFSAIRELLSEVSQ